MKTRQVQGIVFVSLLLMPFVVSAAQTGRIDLKQLRKLPQSISISELTDEYSAIRIGPRAYDGSVQLSQIMTRRFSGISGESQIDMYRYYDVVWTTGDVVKLGNDGYLVTYGFDEVEMSAQQMRPNSRRVEPRLSLNLVKLDGIKSIAPYTDLTPARFKKIFESINKEEKIEPVSDQTQALSKVKQLTIAMMMYVTDYDDLTPYAQATVAVEYVTWPYVKNISIWKTGNPEGSRFYFNMAVAGVKLSDVENPANIVMFYESRAWPDGRRILSFCDGHAKIVTENEWQKYKLTLKLKFKKSAKPLPAYYGINGRIRAPD